MPPIKYLDYTGLERLVSNIKGIITENELVTSKAILELNKKINNIVIPEGSGFPVIEGDIITSLDIAYSTTTNLNEVKEPGQYIIDSTNIVYEGNLNKTLYWLLSVDKISKDGAESIIQTYYPLSYLAYSWYNIPVGGLLYRFYVGGETESGWTDLLIGAPGDVDPNKFITRNEFESTVSEIETSISETNSIIETKFNEAKTYSDGKFEESKNYTDAEITKILTSGEYDSEINEAYNTIKEIAEWIETHEEAVESICKCTPLTEEEINSILV